MNSYELRWDCSDGKNNWSETTLASCTSTEAVLAAARLLFNGPPYPYQMRVVRVSHVANRGLITGEVKLPR